MADLETILILIQKLRKKAEAASMDPVQSTEVIRDIHSQILTLETALELEIKAGRYGGSVG